VLERILYAGSVEVVARLSGDVSVLSVRQRRWANAAILACGRIRTLRCGMEPGSRLSRTAYGWRKGGYELL